ncbi:nucleotide exchange factor GrpE [Limosilactobacillus caecicola]|uniref:nucleotide exchange factor GrpE n=1 Tax=Limosilactobacillus caecicola TaxID=2941332 RepID=UPI002041E156|nr:nucleotide exchange factor GrpE [Limosilactobacillus caecicola]
MAKEAQDKQSTAQEKADDKAQKTTSEKKQPTSAVDELKKQVADLKDQLEEKDNQFLRAEAEIQNMSKRFEKERSQMAKYDGQDLATSILPVLDNLKRALAIEVTDDNGKQLKKGIQMVHDHLEKALQDHGITEVDALGKPFDPNTQQAVQTVDASGDQKADTVVQVLQAGYVLKDRVLRPAMVVVAQ